MRTVRFMASDCDLDRMVHHYRAMSHREPDSAAFWRMRVRAVIGAWRKQSAAPERIAA